VLGADEGDALFFHPASELLVFGQEAVARVHGLCAGGLAGRDDLVGQLVGQQVALAAGGSADEHGLVGQFDVARIAVGLGIHRHRLDAHLLGGLDDAAGDFTPIRNQDLFKHGRPPSG